MKRFGVFMAVALAVVFVGGQVGAKWYTNESLKSHGKKRTSTAAAYDHKTSTTKKESLTSNTRKKRMVWISGRVDKIHIPYRGKKTIEQLERDGLKGINNDAVIILNGHRYLASPNIVEVIKVSKYQRKPADLSDVHRGDDVYMLVRGNRIYRIYIER